MKRYGNFIPFIHICWKFYLILKQEAESGRWNKVKPDKFIILRDKSQAYIVLTYQETGIYDMTFKVGFNENGFDSDVTGEWLTCEYNFKNLLIKSRDKRLLSE